MRQRGAKAIVVLSGGMDSSALAYLVKDQGYQVTALTFDYGQRHLREIQSAAQICQALAIEQHLIRMPQLGKLFTGSALTNPGMIDVPDGHYTDESMKITIVPNRNAILLAVAYGVAVNIGAHIVAYGAHAGDHAIYPDCRPSFMQAFEEMEQEATGLSIPLYTPWATMDKAGIVKNGSLLGVPWDKTYSCYKGAELHCGTCGTCTERREAFSGAGVNDPTTYLSDLRPEAADG